MLLMLKFCKSHQRTGSFTRTFELVLLALDGQLNWYNIATCFQTEPSEEKFKNYTVGKFAHGPKSYIDVLITITLLVAFKSFQNENFRFLELVYHTSLLIREVLKRLALVNHFKLTKNYYHLVLSVVMDHIKLFFYLYIHFKLIHLFGWLWGRLLATVLYF